MLLESFRHDLRHAWRAVWMRRGSSALAAGILALAIGASTAIFTLVHGVLLRDLPFDTPRELVIVWNRFGDDASRDRDVWLSMPEYRDLRADTHTFRDVAALTDRNVTLTDRGGAERLLAIAVSSSFFPMLGVTPALGRTIGPADDTDGVRRVVVLSHDLWRRRFGGDPHIVGRTVQLDEQPYDVAGVLPPGFRLAPLSSVLPASVDVWIALEPHLTPAARTERSFNMLHVLARLAPGVTRREAQARVDAGVAAVAPAFPRVYRGAWHQRLVPLQDQIVQPVRGVLWLLAAAVALVMALAIANVANLLLSHAGSRRREVAVRAALGASRGRLLRQFLIESLLLALAGGGLGYIVALWTVDAISVWAAPVLPALQGVSPDERVLAFTIGLSMLSALLFGLAPAMHGLDSARRGGAALAQTLMGASRALTGDRRRLRRTLVVAQVALALTLLTATLLTLQSLERLLRSSPGFSTAQALSFRIELPARYDTADRRAQFYDRALASLAGLPGVRRAGATSHLPLSGSVLGSTFAAPPSEAATTMNEPFGADHRSISAGYFEAMGVPLLRGRTFTPADRRDAPAVAIIDETLARRLWPRADPIGKTLIWQRGDLPLRIVGVAGAVRHRGLDAPPQETVYRPLTQFTWPAMMVVLQAHGDPAQLAAAARERLRALDAGVPVADVRTLEDVSGRTLGRPALQARVLGAFGLLALLLALAGLYGLLSISVAQRAPEIGLRVALGATPGDVRRLLVGEGLALAGAGVALGLLLSAAAAPLLAGLLYGIRARDPLTYLLAPALLMLTAFAASLLPARRAMRIDPMHALRRD